MKEFNFSFLGGLRNEEFPEFYYRLCSILEVDEVEDVNLKECLMEVISHEDELKFVMKMRNPHRLTAVLADYAEERQSYVISLKGKVFASLKSPIKVERDAAVILAAWMDKHWKGKLYRSSLTTHSNMVRNMMQDQSFSADIQSAIEDLVLMPAIDPIVSVTTNIDEALSVRSREQVANVRKALLIRGAAYKSLKKFFKAVEIALSLEKEGKHFYLDYSKLIDNYLDYYRVRYLARNTRRKNAAEAEANKEANPENGATTGGGVQQMGGKPAMAGRSKTFNVMTGNGTDLQKGGATNTFAMDGSVTNGGATNDGDKNIVDLPAGNGGLLIDDFESLTKEPTQGKHNGAQMNDSSDQES